MTNNIRQLLKIKKVKIIDFVKHLGVTKQAVFKWIKEGDQKTPSAKNRKEIAKYFGLKENEVFNL